jgi:hypothetical protein
MKVKAIAAGVLILVAPQLSRAEDINEIFKKVNGYVTEQNYTKALEELSWAKKEIEKLNSTKIGTLLPTTVNGYTGGEVKVQSALGFDNIERTYTGSGKNIQVSITGGGAAGGPMGGLAGLARMGMMMGGQQPGMDSFRLDGRTANLDTTGGKAELTVFLDSGAILKVEGSGVDGATLKSFAEGLKISNLDNYMRGTK